MLLVDGILCEGSNLLLLSSIASVSKLTAAWRVCVTDAFTCLVFNRGGFLDWGMANARLKAPLGGEGGGYEIPADVEYEFLFSPKFHSFLISVYMQNIARSY